MIISCVNQKGGAGKSTEARSIAYELSKLGRVLLIDADPQGTLIRWSDKRDRKFPNGMSLAALAKKTLYRDLGNLAKGYDHVVIDTPGRLEEITKSAIMASDLLLVPCAASPDDLDPTKDTLEMIRDAALIHQSLKYTFVLNHHKAKNTVLGRYVRKSLSSLGEDFFLLKTEIVHRMVFPEAAADGFFVQEVDKEKKASAEIAELVQELLEIGGRSE